MPSVTGKIQILLIHESSAVTGDGMLTKRQQAWVAGATNDVSIENRVLYK